MAPLAASLTGHGVSRTCSRPNARHMPGAAASDSNLMLVRNQLSGGITKFISGGTHETYVVAIALSSQASS